MCCSNPSDDDTAIGGEIVRSCIDGAVRPLDGHEPTALDPAKGARAARLVSHEDRAIARQPIRPSGVTSHALASVRPGSAPRSTIPVAGVQRNATSVRAGVSPVPTITGRRPKPRWTTISSRRLPTPVRAPRLQAGRRCPTHRGLLPGAAIRDACLSPVLPKLSENARGTHQNFFRRIRGPA